ncbi:SOUL family heme-binding protein [Altererythrobacter sp. GH1-8]|uniref:SOUL family heme-binding protein n=1 Tax=Altererythrobacter sp. GH1-8 TaxID=3349333 RepID=UPI00374D0880
MALGKWITAGLGIAALGGAAAYAQYRSIEKPAYDPVLTEDAFQLRDYAPMIVAQVTHSGERGRALNSGFRRLAAYIFAEDRPGANKDKIAMTSPVIQDRAEARIAMTSPVMQNAVEEGSWRTLFVMPGQYTLETLPKPPEDITLMEVPARRMASVTFNGWGGQRDLIAMERMLREWMAKKDLEATGDAEYAFYDAPMVPGPMRRNEVMIPVASD